jgi:hypothetical protein
MAEAYLRGPRTFLSEEQYLGHKPCDAELAVATTFTVSSEAEEESFTRKSRSWWMRSAHLLIRVRERQTSSQLASILMIARTLRCVA